MNSESVIQHELSNPLSSKSIRMGLVDKDIKEGFANWRIWLLLSWQDIRVRYRRSQLGPFWLTISMAMTIYAMGILYGHLFKLTIHNYFPYLAAGLLTWNFITLLVNEGTCAFFQADNFLKQMKIPFSVFTLRVISRSVIVFLHNSVVLIPLYFIFHIKVGLVTLMFIPGFLLLLTSAFFYGLILAVIGARFRDVAQLIISVMQIIFFITPIMWDPSVLPARYHKWILLNPFAQFVEILRAPLIGMMPTHYSLIFTTIFTLFGVYFARQLLLRVRHRIIYWL